jgi:hypothetical protein
MSDLVIVGIGETLGVSRPSRARVGTICRAGCIGKPLRAQRIRSLRLTKRIVVIGERLTSGA